MICQSGFFCISPQKRSEYRSLRRYLALFIFFNDHAPTGRCVFGLSEVRLISLLQSEKEFPSLSKDKTIKKSSANTLFTLKKVLGCVIFILKILF
jgi:hypothetical protein